MNRRRTLLLLGLASVAAAIAVVGGCAGGGDPTRQEYQASVVETRDEVDAALAQIQQATSEDDFLDRLEAAGARIDDAAGALDDAGAPQRLEDENTKLVRALRGLGSELEATAGQVRDLGFERLLGGAAGLNFESWDTVNTILGRLRKQGIAVQPLERH